MNKINLLAISTLLSVALISITSSVLDLSGNMIDSFFTFDGNLGITISDPDGMARIIYNDIRSPKLVKT